MSLSLRFGVPVLALLGLCASLRVAQAQPLDGMSRWWAQWNDPVLSALIQDAQTHSANIAQAGLRIEQARAAAVTAGASLTPSVGSMRARSAAPCRSARA